MYGKSMDKLLTLQECAEMLRVSERTIMRYIKSGRLKASNIGQWRIKEVDLEKLLNKSKNIKK